MERPNGTLEDFMILSLNAVNKNKFYKNTKNSSATVFNTNLK